MTARVVAIREAVYDELLLASQILMAAGWRQVPSPTELSQEQLQNAADIAGNTAVRMKFKTEMLPALDAFRRQYRK